MLPIALFLTLVIAEEYVQQVVTPIIEVENGLSLTFTLRHVFQHGAYSQPERYEKRDIPSRHIATGQSDHVCAESLLPLSALSKSVAIQRLKDREPLKIEKLLAEARYDGYTMDLPPTAWTTDNILSPDVSDKETVLSFARMAIDAYYINDTCQGWDPVQNNITSDHAFGWEGDGLRGHVFADEKNSTVVISFKGTSKAWWDNQGTETNDKENDNIFASCCCGQQGWPTWRKVCSCAMSAYTCNQTCLIETLREESRYYAASRKIYTNVTMLYPDSNIWLVGHSLGGTVSGLLGLTYGRPTITFEAVPGALAASRLGLPMRPNTRFGEQDMTGIFNFGHTADPIYMGKCNTLTSLCSLAGYAFQSECHTGTRCVYDVVNDKNWSVDLRTHVLRTVIDEVITKYDTVPECVADTECVDCYNWNYVENSSSTATSGKPSATRSSTSSALLTSISPTSTCETPGWWGCLDKKTLTPTTISTSTVTTSARLTTTAVF